MVVRRARRARRARGQPRTLRGAQDKGGAVARRHNGEPQAHQQDNEGQRPEQSIQTQEVQRPSQQAQRGRPAESGRQELRRPVAAHARMSQPDERASHGRVELRLPAPRPREPRGRGAGNGAAQGRRPDEGGLRHARVPDIRHRDLPRRPRQRARQRRRRVNEQDTEGIVRLPKGIRHDWQAADEADGLRALTQQSQATFDCAIHDPGRVQEGRIELLEIVQESVANPKASRALEANPYQQRHRAPKQKNQKENPRRRNFPQREVGFDVGSIPSEVHRRQRMGLLPLSGRASAQEVAVPAASRICAGTQET